MHSTIASFEIATKSPLCDRSPLNQNERITIAQVLCWDMGTEVSADEVITIAIANGVVQIKLTGGRAALLSVNTFKLILQQQRQQLDEDVAYVERLEQKLEKHSAKIEVDARGRVYRVWRGIQLLGTFYRLSKSNWVAEPAHAEPIEGFRSAETAQNAIVQLSNYVQVRIASGRELEVA